MKISFIGYGNMSKAILEGIQEDKSLQLFVASPSLPNAPTPNGITTHFDNKAIVDKADILFLAVKPAKIIAVLAEIKNKLPKQCVVVSIAAGIKLDTLSKGCPPEQPIIRCMPNTPIAVGCGASALIANSYVTLEQKSWVEKLFQSRGISAWVKDESDMNIMTALSGSGPAYVFLFLEAMEKAAKTLGLDSQLAQSFTFQTFRGALKLIEKTGLTPNHLRKKVTSPAGTTEAAIAILQQKGFEDLVMAAVSAAFKRAEEMEKVV